MTAPTYSRKTYEAVARMLVEERFRAEAVVDSGAIGVGDYSDGYLIGRLGALDAMEDRFVALFEADNPRFDAGLFRAAAQP